MQPPAAQEGGEALRPAAVLLVDRQLDPGTPASLQAHPLDRIAWGLDRRAAAQGARGRQPGSTGAAHAPDHGLLWRWAVACELWLGGGAAGRCELGVPASGSPASSSSFWCSALTAALPALPVLAAVGGGCTQHAAAGQMPRPVSPSSVLTGARWRCRECDFCVPQPTQQAPGPARGADGELSGSLGPSGDDAADAWLPVSAPAGTPARCYAA